LPSKEARHVAENLLQLFFQFGPCKILQSDNGKEFTAQIIKDLKIMWPGLVIVNGRPRHPQSQGLVERRNSTLCDILGKFMQDCDTNHWVSCLLPAIHSRNTSIAQGIKHTPFEVVFGQKPRVNMALWQSIADQGIEEEEDLPPSILKQLAEISDTNVTRDEGEI
jgi:transposase InsO family protein